MIHWVTSVCLVFYILERLWICPRHNHGKLAMCFPQVTLSEALTPSFPGAGHFYPLHKFLCRAYSKSRWVFGSWNLNFPFFIFLIKNQTSTIFVQDVAMTTIWNQMIWRDHFGEIIFWPEPTHITGFLESPALTHFFLPILHFSKQFDVVGVHFSRSLNILKNCRLGVAFSNYLTSLPLGTYCGGLTEVLTPYSHLV